MATRRAVFAGLTILKHPHRDLTRIYQKTLAALQHLPESYVYRQRTEELVRQRLKVLEETEDIGAIEQKLECRQFEELVTLGKRELQLAESMRAWKPWEKLTEEAPAHQWTWPPHK